MKDPYSQGISYEDSKKNDSPSAETQPAQGGIFWRLGAGIYNTTTGAVGVGCGVVKYAAQTSYGVVSKTAEVGMTATKAVASGSYNAVSGGVSAVTSKLPVPSFSKVKDKKE